MCQMFELNNWCVNIIFKNINKYYDNIYFYRSSFLDYNQNEINYLT